MTGPSLASQPLTRTDWSGQEVGVVFGVVFKGCGLVEWVWLLREKNAKLGVKKNGQISSKSGQAMGLTGWTYSSTGLC